MASQPAEVTSDFCEIRSFVRGAHAYQEHWQPRTGQMLNLKREPENCRDKCTFAILKAGGTIVGHIPYNFAPLISSFLARDCNKGMVEITGERVNRGAGYGLEVPCVYRLYGPQKYIQRLEGMLSRLRERSLLPESSD